MSIGIDQDRVRWPGSGSAVSGSTPFGFYDNDSIFTAECYKGTIWAATRLGYPIVDIEMIDINFYACFEEAVNEYGAQVNQFNIKNNILNVLGQDRSSDVSGLALQSAPVPYLVQLAKSYGSEIGVGGYTNQKSASVQLTVGQQTYNLQSLVGNTVESGSRIEIRSILHGPSPAFARIYDPFSMTGMSYSNVLNEMGFAGYSPATQFLMTPIFEDLLRGQAIEFNDLVRKSAYSFEIVNNVLKVFPIPTTPFNAWITYVVEKDKYGANFFSGSAYSQVSDYSNVPYQNIQYYTINSVGRQWIRKYFIAICKELLGAIRQKYSTVPIPNGEVTLDGAELRAEAASEKESLITQLREMLESTTLTAQMEAQAGKSDQLQDALRKVPMLIYIG